MIGTHLLAETVSTRPRPVPDELWITLPGFTVNATPARIPALHYRQRRLLVAASLNC